MKIPSAVLILAKRVAKTTRPKDYRERFAAMLSILDEDQQWASEYEYFVVQVSFAKPGETITFAEALAAAKRLVCMACN